MLHFCHLRNWCITPLYCSIRQFMHYSNTGNLNLPLSNRTFLIPSPMGTPTIGWTHEIFNNAFFSDKNEFIARPFFAWEHVIVTHSFIDGWRKAIKHFMVMVKHVFFRKRCKPECPCSPEYIFKLGPRFFTICCL